MVVTIEFTNGKKYVSPPITVGVDKKLARLRRDVGEDSMKASEMQDKAKEIAELDARAAELQIKAEGSTSPEEKEAAADEAAKLKEEATAAALVLIEGYKETENRLQITMDARNALLIQVFGGQFTLDELEDFCPREEAARVMAELNGTTQKVIAKNG